MEELAAFHRELIGTYGYYFQVNTGIRAFRLVLTKELWEDAEDTSPVRFGTGDPTKPGASYQYEKPFSEVVADFSPNGLLEVVLIRSVIVLVVASWEDNYRHRIAKEAGLRHKNDLKSDVFYDLNKYRQAILHAGSTLRVEPRALSIFRKGEQVALTSEHMGQVFRTIVDELNRMGEELHGHNPGFRFDLPGPWVARE